MTRTLAIVCSFSLLALSSCAMDGDHDASFYQAGYGDGCATANAQSTPGAKSQRDDALYAMDEDYRVGWSGGFRDCRAAHP